MVNLEVWLSPVSEAEPCGPNLEYDAEFQQLEEAARAQPDQEFGTGSAIQKIEGAGPAWTDVRRLAESLLARSKDLRIAVHLLRALLHTDGLPALAQGTMLIKELLERFWDGVHPQLDADDNNDPTMRINALAPLAASEATLADVRAAWVVRSRQYGTVSVRDVDVAQGRIPAREGAASYSESQLSAIVAGSLGENPGLVADVRAAFDTVKAISSLLIDRVGAAASIDLKPLISALYPVLQLLEAASPSQGAPAEQAGSDAALPNAAAGSANEPVARPGEIRSRADVMTALEKICDYLTRTEPTNPVPIVLRRAQRMMDMNFLELINDMAPDGLGQAEKVVGRRLDS